MQEPKSLSEALELLKAGKTLVVERSDTGASYVEYLHGEPVLTEYDNEGNLTYWKVLTTVKLNKLLEEIVRDNNV